MCSRPDCFMLGSLVDERSLMYLRNLRLLLLLPILGLAMYLPSLTGEDQQAFGAAKKSPSVTCKQLKKGSPN